MSPRLFCNITYAFLVTGLDREGRKALDRELTAPPGGWDAAAGRFLTRLMEGG